MLTLETAQKIVVENGWLSKTPPSFRCTVLDECRLQSFKAGQSIYEAGDPPGGMFGLVSGGLGIAVTQGERGPFLAHLSRPGAWFGEAAAITRQPRFIGLVAVRAARMFHLSLPKIEEIVTRDPAAWRWFALVPIGHLEMAISACVDLMLRDHAKRCVAVLLRLGGARYVSPRQSSPVGIDISQEEIAVLANVARTTVGRVLGTLEDQGLIEQSYRCIRILAPDALRAMVRD